MGRYVCKYNMESLNKRPNSDRGWDVGHWNLLKRQKTRRRRIRIDFSCIYLCILISYCIADKVLDDVLNAVEKAIVFYSESFTAMNIDGIFGLRVMEGQLELMLRFLRSKSSLDDGLKAVYSRLYKYHRLSKNISDSSLDFLKRTNDHYFMMMNRVIQRPWSFARNYRRIDPTLKWKSSSYTNVALNESLSDQCMNELLGSSTRPPCSISRMCVEVMSVRGRDGYFIAHQLLYSMLAEQSECLDVLNKELLLLSNQSLTVEKLQVEFCANNFFETSKSVMLQHKFIRPVLQDLFLEQELICPMLGFVEFLHIDWLKQIISWQMPMGCFGEDVSIAESSNRKEQRDSGTFDKNVVDFEQPTPARPHKTRPVRHALQEKAESIEKDGVLTGVRLLTNVVPIPAGRNSREEFVGLNSNARKNGYNDSKIRRGNAFMGMGLKDKELGQLGKHHIKLNRRGGFLEQADGERNHEAGRVGDTRMRMEENMGDQGFKGDGNVLNHFIPATETGGVDNQPSRASDEDSFRINRRINRKLLVEKSLNDGCLAHKTAVAMGALSQYLRFLIFANSSGFDADKHLHGINYLTHPDSVLPSFASSSKKKIPIKDIARLSAFGKSITTSKMSVWEDADRSELGRRRDMHVDGLKKHGDSGLPRLVMVPPIDDKDAGNDAIKNVDVTKKGSTFEADIYDDDDANEVALDTVHPVVKSHEDDLLLYQEIVNVKPKVVVAAAVELVSRHVAEASHMHASGDASVEGVSSIGSTYAFVIVITAVILLVLYRSLRKHRMGFVQHRHGRWK